MANRSRFGFINDIRIGGRVVLALSVATVAFIVCAGMYLIDSRQDSAEMTRIADLARLAPTIGNLVHELQR